MSEPMSPDGSWYGDDYECYPEMLESEFYSEFIESHINDFKNLEALTEFVNVLNEIWEELRTLGDDYLLVTCEGRYYETIKKHPMRWSHDTHEYIVAVM